jgi:adenylate cyclase
MTYTPISPLTTIEPRLRDLLPAELYAVTWADPSPPNLVKVFEHLRTLQRMLSDYIPREVSEVLPQPGQVRYEWQEGTLMFTDLAGFTPLMEAHANKGQAGAEALLTVLNAYFAEMIEVISKSGGNLLEFTGDAMLVQFSSTRKKDDTVKAVRAGLRMQRVMAKHFANTQTSEGTFELGMRIGVHTGRFLSADIGTPRRMEHVLLGNTVRETKRTEGAGRVGQVNLTLAAYERVKDKFEFEPGDEGYMLVIDNFTEEQLGEYDILPMNRRAASSVFLDRSVEGLISEIEKTLGQVEPLASYMPTPILNLVVESAAQRKIQPTFPNLVVIFVNLLGLADAANRAQTPEEEESIMSMFSRAFALINAGVEARGGVLKHVTYHLSGSDILIYFGAPNGHNNDPSRAANTALALREAISSLPTLTIDGEKFELRCQMGMSYGPVFAAEIGEPRGRREFNILADAVNTAARLMGKAEINQILLTEELYNRISEKFECASVGMLALKGKSGEMPVYALKSKLS